MQVTLPKMPPKIRRDRNFARAVRFFASFCSRSISSLFSSSAIYTSAFHSRPNWAIRLSIKSKLLFSNLVDKVMTKSGLSQ